jgi:putative polyketide hydroxylase
MEFGQLYRSSAVLGAGAELPPAQRPDQWRGQPGTRAPHVLMTKKGEQEGEKERISSLDLFQRSWVLLSEDAQWCAAAAQARTKLGIDVTSTRMGDDVASEDPAEFRTAFGITEKGASLVRPDGYIAWRCVDQAPASPADVLCDVLKKVAFAKNYA